MKKILSLIGPLRNKEGPMWPAKLGPSQGEGPHRCEVQQRVWKKSADYCLEKADLDFNMI